VQHRAVGGSRVRPIDDGLMNQRAKPRPGPRHPVQTAARHVTDIGDTLQVSVSR
jgi:hypothetical protein